MIRLTAAFAVLGLAAAFFLGTVQSTSAAESTDDYAIDVICVNPEVNLQNCAPAAEVTVQTDGVLRVTFTAAGGHCSDIKVQFNVDGESFTSLSGPLGPDASTSFDLGPVSAGGHTIGVKATGVLGGCNDGSLMRWVGTLDVTTSTTDLVGPPMSIDECKEDGWATFNNPAFKNQGDCVSYVATGGSNPANG